MLLAVAGYLAVQYVTGARAPRCVVVSGEGDGASYEFTPEQAANAATISAVGTSRGMPERAVAIALATAIQESGLRNIGYGDRDSLGLFQQRPSQGWGTEAQILEPAYAAGEFYTHLAEVPDYARLPLTVAAQRVQRSGFPEAYAKHEPDAVLLAAALTGRAAATLTCQGRPDEAHDGGPDAVRAALVRDFGHGVVQPAAAEVNSAPSPSSSPSGTGTVTIPVRTGDASGAAVRRRGWELAHWAVANASVLHVERVSYAGRVWDADGDAGEWHTAGGDGDGDGSGESGGADEATATVRIVTGH